MKDTSNQIFRLLPAVRNIYKNAHRRRPVCVVPIMAIHLSYDIEPENKKCHLQTCKWHFDTRVTMRTSVSGTDTLWLHYSIATTIRQCYPHKKRLSEWEKRYIMPSYSIRNLLSAVPVSVFPVSRSQWAFGCFFLAQYKISLPVWPQSARAAMPVCFFI